MRREELMIDDIISIVEKSRINKMSKYVIYDYLNNHIKKALTHPTITPEQVKESIEYFKNRNSFELPVYDTQQFSNITQYIAELEKSDASKEESSIRYFNEMKALQSKLDKIDTHIFNMEMTEYTDCESVYEDTIKIKSILKEKPND